MLSFWRISEVVLSLEFGYCVAVQQYIAISREIVNPEMRLSLPGYVIVSVSSGDGGNPSPSGEAHITF
jgi:hypothetical protein